MRIHDMPGFIFFTLLTTLFLTFSILAFLADSIGPALGFLGIALLPTWLMWTCVTGKERSEPLEPGTRSEDQEARNLMIDLIVVNDAIRALEAGQVDSFLVGGRMYSRSQLEELRRLRADLRVKAARS